MIGENHHCHNTLAFQDLHGMHELGLPDVDLLSCIDQYTPCTLSVFYGIHQFQQQTSGDFHSR